MEQKSPKRSAGALPLRTELVDRYAAEFTNAAGSDAFDSILLGLIADRSARLAELSAIAKRVLPYPPRGNTRKVVIDALRDMGRAHRSIDLKLRATMGRSAA
jgi:hypothetical protein